MTFPGKLLYLVVISSLIRLLVAGTLELGNDEVYYYTYILHLQWNYFDHPPGVALLIRLTTFNLFFIQEVFIRLGSVLCSALGTWLTYKIGLHIRNERTGWYAALLYNTSIYSSIIAGTFILPDSPQVVFWLAALLVAVKIISYAENGSRIPILYWLLFGILSGLCIMCKVHGIFLWIGFGLYILFYNKAVLLQPWLYVSAFFTLVIISPILIWNINNHFITWQFHSSRVEGQNINVSSFLQAFFGQLFYNNPINVVLVGVAVYHFSNTRFLASSFYRMFLFTGLPVIVVVTVFSLFNSVLPHWSGPGFVSLSFPAAAYLDKRIPAGSAKLPIVLRSSLFLILIVIVTGTLCIRFYPGTIGSKEEENYGSGDFTLDLSGWQDFERQYSAWLQQQNSTKYNHLKIVCDKWFPASHIEYYIARPLHTEVIGVGSLNNLHNFAWLNKTRTDLQKGEDALCIVPSNYASRPEESYRSSFSSVQKLHTFHVERAGKRSRFFTLYLLKNYNPVDEVHTTIIH